jgi:hypothetical protein
VSSALYRANINDTNATIRHNNRNPLYTHKNAGLSYILAYRSLLWILAYRSLLWILAQFTFNTVLVFCLGLPGIYLLGRSSFLDRFVVTENLYRVAETLAYLLVADDTPP